MQPCPYLPGPWDENDKKFLTSPAEEDELRNDDDTNDAKIKIGALISCYGNGYVARSWIWWMLLHVALWYRICTWTWTSGPRILFLSTSYLECRTRHSEMGRADGCSRIIMRSIIRPSFLLLLLLLLVMESCIITSASCRSNGRQTYAYIKANGTELNHLGYGPFRQVLSFGEERKATPSYLRFWCGWSKGRWWHYRVDIIVIGKEIRGCRCRAHIITDHIIVFEGGAFTSPFFFLVFSYLSKKKKKKKKKKRLIIVYFWLCLLDYLTASIVSTHSQPLPIDYSLWQVYRYASYQIIDIAIKQADRLCYYCSEIGSRVFSWWQVRNHII